MSLARRHAAVLAADALHRALGAAAGDGSITLAPNPNRTLVAMSGGVDSAVAAGLAIEAGHEVVGGHARAVGRSRDRRSEELLLAPGARRSTRSGAFEWASRTSRLTAARVFAAEVVDDFLAEHVAGNTPNPCVRCNGRVRFGGNARAGRAARSAAPCHRPLRAPVKRATERMARCSAACSRSRTRTRPTCSPPCPASQLERLWFPLGELTKPEVREIARRQGLGVAEKPESQDLCFLAGTARARFFERHGAGELQSGAGAVLIPRVARSEPTPAMSGSPSASAEGSA